MARVLIEYLAKLKGAGIDQGENQFCYRLRESLWAWLGCTVGIGLCAFVSAQIFEPRDATLLIGSFGASAVLLYGAIKSPLAQPRNLLGGHVLSGAVGVGCFLLLGAGWPAAAMAVSIATAIMILTDTVHPPGGATALIAVIGGEQIHQLGFWYVLVPAGLGAALLLLVALLVNNIPKNRSYPSNWI